MASSKQRSASYAANALLLWRNWSRPSNHAHDYDGKDPRQRMLVLPLSSVERTPCPLAGAVFPILARFMPNLQADFAGCAPWDLSTRLAQQGCSSSRVRYDADVSACANRSHCRLSVCSAPCVRTLMEGGFPQRAVLMRYLARATLSVVDFWAISSCRSAALLSSGGDARLACGPQI